MLEAGLSGLVVGAYVLHLEARVLAARGRSDLLRRVEHRRRVGTGCDLYVGLVRVRVRDRARARARARARVWVS